ncbi:MAG: hypothetical protein RR456_03650 [Victivallaceae bacterium]
MKEKTNIRKKTNPLSGTGFEDVPLYLSFGGTPEGINVTGNIVFNGLSTITDIGSPVNDEDAISLKEFNKKLNERKSFYLKNNETTMIPGLSMNSHPLFSYKTADTHSEPIILSQLNETIDGYLSLNAGEIETVFGNLIFDGKATIKNTSPPLENGDLVTVKDLKNKLTEISAHFISKNAPLMREHLSLENHSVLSLEDPSEDYDGVNRRYFEKMSANYPKQSDNTKMFIGDLYLDKHSVIKNIPDSQVPSDALSMRETSELIRNSDDKDLMIHKKGGIITGKIDMGNNSIINLKDPINDNDLLTVNTLKKILIPYISTEGNGVFNPVTGDLIFNNKKIKNIKPSSLESEAINYGEVKETIKVKQQDYLSNENTVLENSLNMKTHRISRLGEPQEKTDAITLGFLNKTIKTYLTRFLGHKNNLPMEGNIQGSSFSVINLADAVENTEGVNLETSERLASVHKEGFIPLTGGTVNGDIILNDKKITRIPNPQNDDDAINVAYLKQSFKDCIPIKEAVKTEFFNEDFIFEGNLGLSGLSDPTAPKDALTLNTLNSFTKDMIPIRGNSPTRFLNDLMFSEGYGIKGIGDAVENTEVVSLKTLNDCINDFASSFVKNSEDTNISDLVMNGHRIVNLKSSVEDYDLVILSDVLRHTQSLIPLKGENTLAEGDIVFENGRIFMISEPTDEKQPFNKKFMSKFLKTGIDLSGKQSERIKIDLNFDSSHTVKTSTNPMRASDAVNLASTVDIIDKFIKTSPNIISSELTKNLSVLEIADLKEPVNPNDAVRYLDVKKTSESLVPILADSMTELKGDLIFDEQSTLEGLPDPKTEEDVVNLKTCKEILEQYISVSFDKSPLVTDITLNGNMSCKIRGLSNPVFPSDAMNLRTLRLKLSKITPLYAAKNRSNAMRGDLNLEGKKITGIPICKENSDAVNLEFMENYFSSFVPYSSDKEFFCDLNFKNLYTLTDLKEASEKSDVLSLRDLEKITSRYVSYVKNEQSIKMEGNIVCTPKAIINGLSFAESISAPVPLNQLKAIFSTNTFIQTSGGKTEGDLNFGDHGIEGLGRSTLPNSSVTLSELNRKLNDYLSYSGTATGKLLTVNLIFNEFSKIRNIPQAVEDTDLCNLKNLYIETEAIKTRYIVEKDIVCEGDLNMNGKKIQGISDPLDNTDGVNLKTLNTFINDFAAKQSPLPVTLSGPLYLGSSSRIFINKSPINENDAVNTEHAESLINLKKAEIILKNIPSSPEKALHIKGIVTDVGDPVENYDAVNLSSGERIVKEKTDNLIDNNGGIVSGNLIVQGELSGIADPEHDYDAVNLRTLQKAIEALKILLLKNFGGILNGNLQANSFINMGEGVEDTDAIDFPSAFEKTKEIYGNLLSLVAPEINTDLRIANHKITRLAPSEDHFDAVNFGEMLYALETRLPLENRTKEHTIESVWNLNNHTIKGHGDPVTPLEGMNLKILKSSLDTATESLLSSAGTVIGNIDAQGYIFKNMSEAVENKDSVSLKKLRKILSEYIDIRSGIDVLLSSDISAHNHSISLQSEAQEEDDTLTLKDLKLQIEHLNAMIVPKNGSLPMQGNLTIGNLSNLREPTEGSEPVTLTYLNKITEEIKTGFITEDKEDNYSFKNSWQANGNEITNVGFNASNSAGVNLTTLNNIIQDYLSESGGLFSGSLEIQGKVTDLPAPENDDDAANLECLKKETEKTLATLIVADSPLILDTDLTPSAKCRFKDVGYPERYGDATTVEFWKKITDKPFLLKNSETSDTTFRVQKQSYLPWKSSTSNSMYSIGGTFQERLFLKTSGFYMFTSSITVADIKFGMSLDTCLSLELILKNSSVNKILQTVYLSPDSSVCMSSSFKIDIQDPEDPYFLKIKIPLYDCDVYDNGWSLVRLSEAYVSDK